MAKTDCDDVLLLKSLSHYPPQALISRQALASEIGCHERTIKRMEERGELPPAVRFHGRLCYLVGAILNHVAQLFERAQEERARDRRRLGLEGL